MNEFEQQYLPGGLPPAFALGLFRTEHFILGAGDRLDFPDCPRFGEPEYQQTKLRQKLFLHLHSGGDCDSASELCWATAGHVAICRSDVIFSPYIGRSAARKNRAARLMLSADMKNCGCKGKIDEKGQKVHNCRDDRRRHDRRVEAELLCQQRQRTTDELGQETPSQPSTGSPQARPTS